MKIRQLKETDIEDLLSLWNRNMQFDPMSPELLEEKVWDDPDYAADMAYVVEHEKQVIAFIMGIIRQKEDGPMGYIKKLVVDKKFQRRGMGGRLLREMERLLYRRNVRTVRILESAPNYLTPGLDVRYTKGLIFFEQHGYQRFDETYNLDVDLDEQSFDTAEKERALAAGGIEIRRALPQDSQATEAFVQQEWAAWVPEVRQCFKNNPLSLHLAIQDGQIIAFSGYDGNNLGTGAFGPVGTTPACRGKGVGGVLTLRCLKDIKAQGRRYAIVPWIGPLKFYVHYAGAEIARVFHRYQKVFQ